MSSTRFRQIRMAAALPALAGLILAVTMSPAAGAALAASSTAADAHAVTGHASCARPVTNGFHCMSFWHAMAQPSKSSLARLTSSTAALPVGISPADIKAAYKLPSAGGAGQTVAIVDAFDNPNVEADLKTYRATWKLPPCTTADKCFTKVDQRGGKQYPIGDPGWGVEISLDVQAVSAACPACRILLVEADDTSFDSIGAAENTAVRLGATIVSNSYGSDEFNGVIALGKKYYTHPGVAVVASTGDYGFRVASFPAVLRSTWAVGGTYLSQTATGGWTEQAASFGGSGCSAWITKPSVQTDRNCAMRTVSDISAIADSDDGYAVYDTYGLDADNGWIGVGGTSVSAPLISGMIGLAGNAVTADHPSYAYRHRSGLADVVGGSNGYCGGDYLCTGVKGYDAPTGLGSPRGLASL